MANKNNEWPDSMFSFSFEPEILTFLWGVCTKKVDTIQRDYRYLIPDTSSLLQIFVPYEGERANFVTFLKATVITGGTLICVGLLSFGTFKTLQKLRYNGLDGVKNVALNLGNCFQTRKNLNKSHSLELVLQRGGGDDQPRPINGDADLIKRPSDLTIHGHSNSNTALPSENRLTTNGNNTNIMDHPLFSMSPITNGDVASGDEDMGEVQGQYFGPTSGITTISSAIIGSSISPRKEQEEDPLQERYDLLKQRQPLPCLSPPLPSSSSSNQTSSIS